MNRTYPVKPPKAKGTISKQFTKVQTWRKWCAWEYLSSHNPTKPPQLLHHLLQNHSSFPTELTAPTYPFSHPPTMVTN